MSYKITDLIVETTPASDDLIPIVDVSDTTQSVGGSTNKITFGNLIESSTITMTNKTLTAPKFVQNGFIADSNGNELVKFQQNTSAINYITIINAAIGNAPAIVVSGDDTNPNLEIRTKGTGDIILADPLSREILVANGIAAAVNEITVNNAITNNAPSLSATGDDTNIDLKLTPKGTGGIKIGTGTVPVTDVVDQDDMLDDSATQLATQQSIKKYVDDNAGSADGWTSSADTWVYASASTFTIAGVDRTTTYTKGTRLKFAQTTTKYAVVVSSTFSTNTTVTIAVNTDHVIANAAITSPNYSYQVNPQGYPAYFSYTPTFTNFTIGNGTITRAVFFMDGGSVNVSMKITLGSTSSVSGSIQGTLPVTSASIYTGNVDAIGTAWIRDTGTTIFAAAPYFNSTTKFSLFPSSAGATYTTIATATSSTVPMTWTTNDQFGIEIRYFAA